LRIFEQINDKLQDKSFVQSAVTQAGKQKEKSVVKGKENEDSGSESSSDDEAKV